MKERSRDGFGLVDAKPLGGVQKKGSDKGIDGKIMFTDEHGRPEQPPTMCRL